MTEKTVSNSIRTALIPLCYKDFDCLAGACRDNCCGGWMITFQKKDYLHIKRAAQSAEMKNLLSTGMSRVREKELTEQGVYAQFNMDKNGQCRFQTEEGLCRLQLECGESVLPYVCRIYPRRQSYTPAACQYSLSPSCEGVLALLWDLPQGIDFVEEALPQTDWRRVTMSEPVARFAEIQSLCVDALQERSLKMSQRMLLLGILLQKLCGKDWTLEGTFEAWRVWAGEVLRAPETIAVLEQMPRNQAQFLAENVRVLLKLYNSEQFQSPIARELLPVISAKEDWMSQKSGQFSIHRARYQELEKRLDGLLGGSEYFFENLMVMSALYLDFPDLPSPATLWMSYVSLSSLYSFYRFAAVCGCYQEVSKERLFHVLVYASRGFLHNQGRRAQLRNELIEHESATLAHLAILTGG